MPFVFLTVVTTLQSRSGSRRRFRQNFGKKNTVLRCFDTVFQRPYRYFSIALKVVFSLSDRYKIFTSNWLWIEICECTFK